MLDTPTQVETQMHDILHETQKSCIIEVAAQQERTETNKDIPAQGFHSPKKDDPEDNLQLHFNAPKIQIILIFLFLPSKKTAITNASFGL